VIGRFISADTIVPNPTNPQAFNRYSYVLNNPLRYIDPTGHGNFFSDLWKGIKKFFSKPLAAVFLQGVDKVTGSYFLSRSETGRKILLTEYVVAEVVINFEMIKEIKVAAAVASSSAKLAANVPANMTYQFLQRITYYPPGYYAAGLITTDAIGGATASVLGSGIASTTLGSDGSNPFVGNSLGANVNNNILQQTDTKTLLNTFEGYQRILHPLELTFVNMSIFFASGGAYVASVAAIVGGCITPTPAEPATCAAGIVTGGVFSFTGREMNKAGVDLFNNYTWPAWKELWGNLVDY
jgi:hypothetical protein